MIVKLLFSDQTSNSTRLYAHFFIQKHSMIIEKLLNVYKSLSDNNDEFNISN